LKLNGTNLLVVNADDVNILGWSLHTIKKNAKAVVVASKEIGLEINADKTKCMVMSRDQNTGQITTYKMIIVLLKGWKNSNIGVQP